ncbi:LysR family transcriptional regulator [Novosphingobium flavum]|uniref:LysR family transcriptional regulator n=1 Tax=Novosphingobium flavum TaxID=1778672 RepID=A0A7X1KKT0_9SPHN|nr:LysR family transcriptional regulator [Novosphingobium flavum]MBC2664812.1 LysR family transcriptional regulator [Novosphingobium flavum]
MPPSALQPKPPRRIAGEKSEYSGINTVFGFFPSLRLIRAFAAVAEAESISQASIDLNLSQSAVTQAIARLEAELGSPLFERRSKGSYLTEVGKILKEHTDKLFANMEEALREFAAGSSAHGGASVQSLSMRLTKSQVLALISIKESGSFMQAARRIGVAQPTIHRSARTLEGNLNAQLFSNTARGSTVNEVGYRLANRLHLAVREFEWAYERIEAQKLRERGRILVGGLLLAGSGFLASAISAFSATHPDVNVDIATASYDVLLERLRAGSIDFIVGLLKLPPPTDDVVEEILAPDPYVIAVRRDHPLAGRENVTVEDLARYDWVMPGPLTARRANFEMLFSDFPTEPRTNIETYSLTILSLLLAESDRMTILTESQILLDQSLGHTLAKVPYRLAQEDAFIGVTTRRNWVPSDIQKNFLDFLRKTQMTGRLRAQAAERGMARSAG